MDSFGPQELLEPLSQASGGSRSSGKAGSQNQQHARGINSGATNGRYNSAPQHQTYQNTQGSLLSHSLRQSHIEESSTSGFGAQRSQQSAFNSSLTHSFVGGGNTTGTATSQSQHQHHVDEAYRRLGQRLSAQAHGDMPPPPSHRPLVVQLYSHENSSFRPYQRGEVTAAAGEGSGVSPVPPLPAVREDDSRTSKVQKVTYSDHGHHT